MGAEDVEPAPGHAGATQTLGHGGAGVIEVAGIEQRGRFELLRTVQHIGEIGDGDPDIAQRQLVVVNPQGHDAAGVGNAGGGEQNLDRGIGADPESQRDESHHGVGGVFSRARTA